NTDRDLTYAIVADETTHTTFAAVRAGTNSPTTILASSDDGLTWAPISTLPSETSDVQAMMIDPIDASLWLGAASGSGIYRSSDRGVTFAASNRGLQNGAVESIAIDATSPRTLYAAVNGFFAKSIDGGASWTRSKPSADGAVRRIAIDAATPST